MIPNPTGWDGEVWKHGDEFAGKMDLLKLEMPIASFFQYQNSRFVDKGCTIRWYDASVDAGNDSVRHRIVQALIIARSFPYLPTPATTVPGIILVAVLVAWPVQVAVERCTGGVSRA